MTKREVTEQDFRMPEYRDAKPEDYEFRADGKLVRKDRWERGIRSIVGILGMSRDDFEVDYIVENVRARHGSVQKLLKLEYALKEIVDLHENESRQRDASLLTAYGIAKDALKEIKEE